MNQQMNLTDFFAMEAGEYLERLDAIVSAAARPDTEELVRLARALRGSALMANQQTISTAAAAFERFLRVVREDRIPWDDAAKQLAIRAVDDLKVLVRNVRSWSDADEQRARKISAQLDQLAGPSTGVTGKHAAVKLAQGLDAGTRAYIGREGAAVASALDQAAKALQQNPLASEPLQRILKVMQPLRGLAVLGDVPPVGDILDGVERAIGAVIERSGPAPNAALVFSAAARALSKAAQEVAGDGRADVDSPLARDFATRLRALLDEDAVPIESLYYDDAGPHIVARGTIAGRPGEFGRVALVSHGEHLLKAADELDRAQSATQRELRAQALLGTFRSLAAQSGGPIANAASDFAHAAREALTGGAAVNQTEAFTGELKTVGKILSGATGEDESSAAARIARSVDTLKRLARGAVGLPAAAAAGGPLARPRAASAALAPPPTAAVAPADAAAAPTAPPGPSAPASGSGWPEAPGLAGSWNRYERYVAALGIAEPSLEELLAGPPPDPTAAAAAEGAPPPEPAPAPAKAEVGGEAVDIRSLCYSGRDALERAKSLRHDVTALLADPSADRRAISELVEEILDLVDLGIQHA